MGYAYTQVLCVLAILGVLCSLATPTFKQLRHSNKITTSLVTIQHVVNFAHSTALANNTTVIIQGIDHDWNNGIELVTQNKVLKQIHALPIETLTWNGFGNNDQIAIMPSGMSFHNGHFTLKIGEQICLLYLNNAIKMYHLCT